MPDLTSPSPRPRGGAPLRWHLMRWRRAEPGPRGFAWLALLTLGIVLPLDQLGVDVAWADQSRTFMSLAIVMAAINVGRSAGLPDESERWLVLQGHSPGDWLLARWTANLAPLAAIALFWAAAIAAVGIARGETIDWISVAGLAFYLLVVGGILTSLLALFGASGVQQPAEAMLGVLLVTVLVSVVSTLYSSPWISGASILLPPVLEASGLRSALRSGAWAEATQAGLRIATWCGVALGVAVVLSGRRIPRRGSRSA